MEENEQVAAETASSEVCPFAYFMSTLGGKWKPAIVCVLATRGATRYSVIKRCLTGITNMMLSRSLKELEADGIVDRVQYNEVPPRVEYSLTEKGQSAIPVLVNIASWAVPHLGESGASGAHCSACSSTQ